MNCCTQSAPVEVPRRRFAAAVSIDSCRRYAAALGLSLACVLCGCMRPSAAAPVVSSADAHAQSASAIVVPEAPRVALLSRAVVARGLRNPRGMQPLAGNALLVSEAGTGAPDDPQTGRVLRLDDHNADGDYLDDGEQSVLLDKQPSKNILDIVRRDEVFGMAGMAEGDGKVLVALAF